MGAPAKRHLTCFLDSLATLPPLATAHTLCQGDARLTLQNAVHETHVPSVKNFRLGLALPSAHAAKAAVRAGCGGTEAANEAACVPLMQLTKLGPDRFEVCFAQPFSALQAFGLALSRFDTKQVK